MPAKKPVLGTPLWIRIWHWTVAILFTTLVFTGVVLTFSAWNFAVMDYDLATTLHDWTGIALSVLYVLFLATVFATGYWRGYLRLSRGLWRRLRGQTARVLRWSAHSSADGRDQQTLLDTMQPLIFLWQQFLYLISISILLPLLIATGLFYLYPETAPAEVMGFDGLWPMALAHYAAGLLGTLFLLFHVYISTIGGFKRMVFGR